MSSHIRTHLFSIGISGKTIIRVRIFFPTQSVRFSFTRVFIDFHKDSAFLVWTFDGVRVRRITDDNYHKFNLKIELRNTSAKMMKFDGDDKFWSKTLSTSNESDDG